MILQKALYGHPDAGGHWEQHCNAHLKKCGFNPIENWPNMFHHSELQLMLMVYVDDFKMSGPAENMAKGWKLIKDGLNIDTPGPVSKMLGCYHREGTGTVNGKKVRTMEYDM